MTKFLGRTNLDDEYIHLRVIISDIYTQVGICLQNRKNLFNLTFQTGRRLK